MNTCGQLSSDEHVAWRALSQKIGPTGVIRLSASNARERFGAGIVAGLRDAGCLAWDDAGVLRACAPACACAGGVSKTKISSPLPFGEEVVDLGLRPSMTSEASAPKGAQPEPVRSLDDLAPAKAARSLASHFAARSTQFAWGRPGSVNAEALRGSFRRWIAEDGLKPSQIEAMIDAFFKARLFDQIPGAPAWRSFLFQRQQVLEMLESKVDYQAARMQAEEMGYKIMVVGD